MIDEGYIKFHSDWHRSPALDCAEIDELVRWRRPLFDTGLIGYYADAGIGYGNISARTGQSGRFVISGTQTGHLPELDAAHFVLVTGCDLDTATVSSEGPLEPSSESMTHAAIYDLDTRICAVVHVHSDELWLALRHKLPTTADDVQYGTPAMAQAFSRLYRHSAFPATGVAVMAGHQGGLLAIGRSVQEASERILSISADAAS